MANPWGDITLSLDFLCPCPKTVKHSKPSAMFVTSRPQSPMLVLWLTSHGPSTVISLLPATLLLPNAMSAANGFDQHCSYKFYICLLFQILHFLLQTCTAAVFVQYWLDDDYFMIFSRNFHHQSRVLMLIMTKMDKTLDSNKVLWFK